jgi:hypothetical protein
VRRVAVAFACLVLAHVAFAVAMRRDFGTAGALTVAAAGIGSLIVLGVPAFLLFRRRGWLAWWQFGAGGGVLGLVAAMPFAVGGGLTLGAALAPAFTALGMLHALLFWVTGVWRNKALTGSSA